MASLSLPFSLTRPSPNEGVTDASEIDDKIYKKSQHAINADLYAKLANGGGGDGIGSSLGHLSTDSSYSVIVLDPSLTFASQITQENTIYVIQDEFDLEGNIVWMKNNITLWFYGGCLKNGCLKNMREAKPNLYLKTLVYSSCEKVCFSDVILWGRYEGVGYDWMFEDTQRNDDYLTLYNMLHFAKSEIVSKKQLNLTSWLNPYYDRYDITPKNKGEYIASYKAILVWSGFELDGHDSSINILMSDQEKAQQCGIDDGRYGVKLECQLIRLQSQFDGVLTNDIVFRNVKIYDDCTINEKGSDPSKYTVEVVIGEDGETKDAKFHSAFMNRAGMGGVTFENVIYRGRCQFFQTSGKNKPFDYTGYLPNMYVNNCDIYVFNAFIFELFNNSGKQFSACYYNNCLFRGTSAVSSNSAVRDKEIYNNCIIDECTCANEDIGGVFYQYNNCIFKRGAYPLYGNPVNEVAKEMNSCSFECYGLSPLRIEESGFQMKTINCLGKAVYKNCSWITDPTSDPAYRAMYTIKKSNDIQYELDKAETQEEKDAIIARYNEQLKNSRLEMYDCTIQMPDSLSFNGDFYEGSVIIQNCKIQVLSKSYPRFFNAREMRVNVTEDTELIGLLRNPTKIDESNKNTIYGRYACGWNYLSPPSNAVVLNEKIVSCKDSAISFCNSDIKFYGNVFSFTFLIDLPTLNYKVYTATEDNFLFSCVIGDYKFNFINKYGGDSISMTVTDTRDGSSLSASITPKQGLHNYTISFDNSEKPSVLIDDTKVSFKNIGTDDWRVIDLDGNEMHSTKITVGALCGIKQIIVKPFAII